MQSAYAEIRIAKISRFGVPPVIVDDRNYPQRADETPMHRESEHGRERRKQQTSDNQDESCDESFPRSDSPSAFVTANPPED